MNKYIISGLPYVSFLAALLIPTWKAIFKTSLEWHNMRSQVPHS